MPIVSINITMEKKTISYRELADKVGDLILFNNLPSVDDYWYDGLLLQPLLEKVLDEKNNEIVDEDGEGEPITIHDLVSETYQTYHISQSGAEYLVNHTAELVSYSEKLDAWFWHITHFGTSWSGVYVDVYEYDISEDVELYYTHEDLMRLKAY